MSSTLLEVTRAAHEEVERMERLVVQDLQREPVSGRERLFQNHRVRNMIETVVTTTEKLVRILREYFFIVLDGLQIWGNDVFFCRLIFMKTLMGLGRKRFLYWEDRWRLVRICSVPSMTN